MSRDGHSPRDDNIKGRATVIGMITILGMVTILRMVAVLGTALVLSMANGKGMVKTAVWTPICVLRNFIWSSYLKFGTDRQTDSTIYRVAPQLKSIKIVHIAYKQLSMFANNSKWFKLVQNESK